MAHFQRVKRIIRNFGGMGITVCFDQDGQQIHELHIKDDDETADWQRERLLTYWADEQTSVEDGTNLTFKSPWSDDEMRAMLEDFKQNPPGPDDPRTKAADGLNKGINDSLNNLLDGTGTTRTYHIRSTYDEWAANYDLWPEGRTWLGGPWPTLEAAWHEVEHYLLTSQRWHPALAGLAPFGQTMPTAHFGDTTILNDAETITITPA